MIFNFRTMVFLLRTVYKKLISTELLLFLVPRRIVGCAEWRNIGSQIVRCAEWRNFRSCTECRRNNNIQKYCRVHWINIGYELPWSCSLVFNHSNLFSISTLQDFNLFRIILSQHLRFNICLWYDNVKRFLPLFFGSKNSTCAPYKLKRFSEFFCSFWIRRHVKFKLFNWISSRKRKDCETVLACSYGAQEESFQQKRDSKSHYTVPLSMHPLL